MMSSASPIASPFPLHSSAHNFVPNKNALFPLTSIPVSSLNHTHSLIFSSNGYWVSLRSRLHAKSREFDTKGSVSASSSTTTSFLSFLCPLLKFFSGGDPSRERNYNLEVATSSLSTLARLLWGSRSLLDNLNDQETTNLDPPIPLQLFDFEACPFCRRVREVMTELDLSAEVYPLSKRLCKASGIRQKNWWQRAVCDSCSVIVKYLFEQYGKGRSPSMGLLESTLFTGWMPTILRAGRGMTLWEKARLDPPSRKLELFSYENNPYARLVREALCELELPYILQNVGIGSKRTKLLLDASGFQEVPYLIDPNTGAQIGDYKKILAYLFQTYSAAAT